MTRDCTYCPGHCCPEWTPGQSSWHHEYPRHCPAWGEDLDNTWPWIRQWCREESSHCLCALQTEIIRCCLPQTPVILHGKHEIQVLFGWPWSMVETWDRPQKWPWVLFLYSMLCWWCFSDSPWCPTHLNKTWKLVLKVEGGLSRRPGCWPWR